MNKLVSGKRLSIVMVLALALTLAMASLAFAAQPLGEVANVDMDNFNQPIGSSAIITATPVDADYDMYQWWVIADGEQDSKCLGSWSKDNTFNVNTFSAKAGEYGIYLNIAKAADFKDGAVDPANVKTTYFKVFIGKSVTLDEAVIQDGKLVVAASSNFANPDYQFWYELPNGEWKCSWYGEGASRAIDLEGATGSFKVIAYAKDKDFSLDNLKWTVWSDVETATVSTEELQVVEVSAINPTEIQVTFNQDVDSASARDLSNYVLSINTTKYDTAAGIAALIEPASVTGTVLNLTEFNAKTNTVTFKLAAANYLENADKYSIDVKDGVLSKDKTQKVAKHVDEVKTFNDTKAPVLVDAYAVGTDLVLEFNEPVTAISSVKINDITLVATPSYSTATGDYTVTLTGAIAEQASFSTVGTHTVVAYNVEDAATNATLTNKALVATGTYTISNDLIAPSVVKVEQVAGNDRAFDITFSEAVVNVAPAELELVIKKGNHTFADDTAPVPTTADYYAVTQHSAKVYRVTFTPVAGAANVNPLYAEGENSVSLAVSVKGFKDLANNVGNPYTGTVKLTKNLSAPAIKPGLDNKIDSTGVLVVKFNKAITSVGSTLDTDKITVTDKDGFTRTVNTATIQNNDEIAISLENFTTDVLLNEKAPFTVSIAAGTVQSSNNVKNAITSVKINPTTVDDAVVAFGGTITDSNTVVNGVVVNKIAIDYGVEMSASAAVLSNYKLDGKALPAGTKISVDQANEVVTITLPEGFAKVNNSQLLEISKDVKTKNGSRIVDNVTTKEAYTDLVTLEDNTQPLLQKAEYFVTDMDTDTETKVIKLTFSEAITGSFDTDDLTVVVNGAKKAITSVTAGTKATELLVTLDNDLNILNATTINVIVEGTNNPAMTIKDAAGNHAKATSIQVSGKVNQ